MATSPLQVLVHLDTFPSMPHRLAAARAIAGQFGAALSALYAVTPAFVELPFSPEMGPTLAADLAALDDDRRAKTLQAFDKAMTTPGVLAAWTQANGFPVTGLFTQQALFADLLVLGQHQPGGENSHAVPPDFVESVLADSGRPAVVIPYVGWSGPIGQTVAIAWKETPEAARAVTAALPFLQRARHVHVLCWGDAEELAIGGRALDLDGYLRLHGVTASWQHGGPEPGVVGELLLSRACDLGADLLVMGCYGHGRAREWILGGASRTVLRSMTLPVLMAH